MLYDLEQTYIDEGISVNKLHRRILQLLRITLTSLLPVLLSITL